MQASAFQKLSRYLLPALSAHSSKTPRWARIPAPFPSILNRFILVNFDLQPAITLPIFAFPSFTHTALYRFSPLWAPPLSLGAFASNARFLIPNVPQRTNAPCTQWPSPNPRVPALETSHLQPSLKPDGLWHESPHPSRRGRIVPRTLPIPMGINGIQPAPAQDNNADAPNCSGSTDKSAARGLHPSSKESLRFPGCYWQAPSSD